MKFLFGSILMLLSFSASAAFNDCNCPQVTCEPCQVQIFLGKEAKSCGIGATIQCEKVVCENVDNYFQCVAGAQPLSYPPQNRMTPITEPQISNIDRLQKSTLPEINFDHIGASQDWELEESAPSIGEDPQMPIFARKIIDGLVEATVNPEDFKHLRGPASMPPPQDRLQVVQVRGDARTSAKSKLKKNEFIKMGQFIQVKSPTTFQLVYGQSPFKLNLKKDSELLFSQEDQHLLIHLMKGSVSFENEDRTQESLFVFPFGTWRMGKRSGSLQWEKGSAIQTVKNISGPAWIRRNELMEKPLRVDEGQSFEIESQNLISRFLELPEKTPKMENYTLSVPAGKVQQRGLASEGSAFCQAPEAQYEQCAWKCFGNNKKSCDTQQKNVRCVRFTCSASGEWKLPTFSPGSACEPTQVRIGTCQ